MALLTLENVSKSFGGLNAVSDLSMTLEPGHIYALIGPNGAGKTTVFNMITGVYQLSGGRITFDGKDLKGVPPHEIVQLGIARTYQNIRLFKKASALRRSSSVVSCVAMTILLNFVSGPAAFAPAPRWG